MDEKMRAVVVDLEKGALFEEDYPIPEPDKGEALIKVTMAGICNTDLEVLKGYMGFKGVLGHEVLGTVAAVEENQRIKIGDRVVGEINLACEQCEVCQGGGFAKRNHCPNRTTYGIMRKDGAFCDYTTLPIVNLHLVPESLPDNIAVFAEPLAAAFRIVEQEPYKAGDAVAVIGDGKLGQCCADILRMESEKFKFKRVLLIGKHEDKISLAGNSIETHLYNEDTGKTLEDAFDVVVEASGSPSGVMLAASITKPLGTVVLKTTCAAGATSFNTALFVIKELNIVGSRCGNFPMALQAMAEGKLNMERLITKTYPFSQALDAIKHAGTKGTLKIQLVMEDVTN